MKNKRKYTVRNYTVGNVCEARNAIVSLAAMMADDNMALAIENERLTRQLETPGSEGMTRLQAVFYEKGRKEVFKDGYHEYRDVRVVRDEDGAISAMPFEMWAEGALTDWDFPSCISKDDFLREFDAELREKYEAKKAAAVAALEEEE